MKSIQLLFLFLIMACASGSPLPELPFIQKRYHLCTEKEVTPHFGKACFRRCIHTNWLNVCNKYELQIEDLTKPDVHSRFQAANFVLISEEKLK